MNTTQENEEFYELLQEFLDDATPLLDDTVYDASNNLFGTNSNASALNDITQMTLTLSAANKGLYTEGPVTISIQAKRGTPVSTKRFSCFIYANDYYLMCESTKTGVCERKGGNRYEIEIPCTHVWLPGEYVLMVRDNREMGLARIPFTIDEELKATLGKSEPCASGGLDDVRTTGTDEKEDTLRTLSTMAGTAGLCQYALKCRQLKLYNQYRVFLDADKLAVNQNMLIYTRNDDWDMSVLKLFQQQVVEGYEFTYLDCSTLYNATLANPYDDLTELMHNTARQVYCLTNLSALMSTGGKVVVRRFMDRAHEDSKSYKLWLVGSRQEIDSLLEIHPTLRELFLRYNHVEQHPYTAFELVQAFSESVSDENIETTEEVTDTLARDILRLYQHGSLTNWTLSNIRRFVAEEVVPRYLKRAIEEAGNATVVRVPSLAVEDINMGALPHSNSAFEDSIEELQRMVGLEDIKHSIITMANQARFFMERKKSGLQTTSNATYHAIFTGNPGTGKTTVAKMLGKIYHAIGLLSKGEVICADRTRLIGRYIGETEENMKELLEEARGNVLFIDEAYNLCDGTSDRKDYGNKVIDSLLTVLTQPNPDMVIIFAGYEKEMDAMLSSNPGLMGRFPYKYRFSDYSAEQLLNIACHLFEQDEYILAEEAHSKLQEVIGETVAQKTKNFGNARWIDQFVKNGILSAMANRVVNASLKDYQHVLVSDVEEGYKRFNPRMVTLTPHRKIGFSA